jgi:hypothetical protein
VHCPPLPASVDDVKARNARAVAQVTPDKLIPL